MFNNRILARGLSFYLEDDHRQPIAPENTRSQEVRNALGNAVTQWMGALQDLEPDLTALARAAFAEPVAGPLCAYDVHAGRAGRPPRPPRSSCAM